MSEKVEVRVSLRDLIQNELNPIREELKKLSSSKPQFVLKCPDGNCGFETNDIGKFVDHRLGALFNTLKQYTDKCVGDACKKLEERFNERLREVSESVKGRGESKGWSWGRQVKSG